MGPKTLLWLSFSLTLIATLRAERRDIVDFQIARRNRDSCCHLSDRVLTRVPNNQDCTYYIRTCTKGCPHSSNYTGSVTMDVPPVTSSGQTSNVEICPIRSAQDDRVCCRPTQVQKATFWCNEDQYIYEYATDCGCGPCIDEEQGDYCYLRKRYQSRFHASNWFYCQTDAPVLVPYCYGLCSSSESDTFVSVNNGQYKVKIGEKDCNCCRASKYTTAELVRVKCYKQFFSHQIGVVIDTTLTTISECKCRNCLRQIFGVRAASAEVSPESDEAVDFPDGLDAN